MAQVLCRPPRQDHRVDRRTHALLAMRDPLVFFLRQRGCLDAERYTGRRNGCVRDREYRRAHFRTTVVAMRELMNAGGLDRSFDGVLRSSAGLFDLQYNRNPNLGISDMAYAAPRHSVSDAH